MPFEILTISFNNLASHSQTEKQNEHMVDKKLRNQIASIVKWVHKSPLFPLDMPIPLPLTPYASGFGPCMEE
jgi:hypothetical protein